MLGADRFIGTELSKLTREGTEFCAGKTVVLIGDIIHGIHGTDAEAEIQEQELCSKERVVTLFTLPARKSLSLLP